MMHSRTACWRSTVIASRAKDVPVMPVILLLGGVLGLAGCGSGSDAATSTAVEAAPGTAEPTTASDPTGSPASTAAATSADPTDVEAAAADEDPGPGGELQVSQPLPPGQTELHGRFGEHRFWMRVTPKHPEVKQPLVRLQYQPPAKEALGGAILSEQPLLAITTTGAIVGWKDDAAECLSHVVYRPASGDYLVQREEILEAGRDSIPITKQVEIPGPLAWDLRLAPMMLAAIWRAGSEGSVAAIDFFGADEARRQRLSWSRGQVAIDGEPRWTIVADADGYMHELRDSNDEQVLSVAGRSYLTPAEADERRRRIEAMDE